MSYQLRHKEFGIYQGSCLGLGFWYPLSDMPEQGFCEFPSYSEAMEYLRFLCSDECDDPLNPIDLSIEPYDKEMSERLIKRGARQ